MITDKEIDCVLKPGQGKKGSLYISNLAAAEDAKRLKSLGVRFVITVANINVAALREIYKEHDIQHHVIEVADKRDIALEEHFLPTFHLIEEQELPRRRNLKLHSVLVHCYVGVSRSATIVLAYLMRLRSLTYQKALQFLKTKRPDVMPNVGFIQKLLDLEETVAKKQPPAKKKKSR